MLQYFENIDVSFPYRYIESYRIGRLNFDFFRYRGLSSQLFFVREGRFYIPNSAGIKEYSYVRGLIDQSTQS